MRLILFLILLINSNSYAENTSATSPVTPSSEKPAAVPEKPIKPVKPVPPPYVAPDPEWGLRLEKKGKSLIHKGIVFEHLSQLRDLYTKQNYQLVWYQNQKLIPEAKLLVDFAKTAKNEGLEPNDYFVTFLENCFKQPCEEKDVDILLSEAFIRYTTHLRQGRFKPREVDGDWFMKPSPWNAVEILLETLKNGKMKEVLEDSPPKHSQYIKFREMFNQMLAQKNNNTEAEIPKERLRIGMKSPTIKILRQRLVKLGDLSDNNGSDEFDEELQQAVKSFQKRSSLKADGLIGEQTRQLLNEGLSFSQTTFRHIQATLERWRWMPRELGDNYIMVNLPNYRLDVIENEKSVLNMKAIVGRPDRRSPTLNDKITEVIINPSWFVPQSLMSEHMAEKGFKISKSKTGIRMRQPPGDNNALGRIKFALTNGHNIYLHDTPKRHLFGNSDRAYSSGCIRLEEPFDLLDYLIKDEKKVEKIADHLDTDTKTRYYPLANPVPVYLTYQTLWFDQNGQLQKLKDIYDVDGDLIDAFINLDPHPAASEIKKNSEDD
jgi:L,D-transpeptidase YcbB